MKTDKLSESGLIGKDGRLRMPMDRINGFCSQHKGERIVMTLNAYPGGTTEAQRGYYYGYVLPSMVAAHEELGRRITDEDLDEELVTYYPGEKAFMCKYQARYFSKTEMSRFLEWVKQYAAENLHVYVDDPRTI